MAQFEIFLFLIAIFISNICIAREPITDYLDDTQFIGYESWITFTIGDKHCASYEEPLPGEVRDIGCENRALEHHYGQNAYKVKISTTNLSKPLFNQIKLSLQTYYLILLQQVFL
jgi:hypothetical protein